MSLRGALALVLLAPAVVASACAVDRAPPGATWEPRWAIDEGADPVVWDGRSGTPIDPDALFERLLSADVVLVGEEHGDAGFQSTQLQVVQLAERASFHAVGIEWVPWSERAIVRGLVTVTNDGVTDPAQHLREVYEQLAWPETWGHDFSAYAPLWQFFQSRMLWVEPLNARPELARAVARGEVESLDPALRAELPPLDSGTPAHRAWFRERMAAAAGGHGGGHGHGHGAMDDATLERFYQAQLVWDETMAQHVRDLAAQAPGHKVVVLAGLGHTERGLGIAARLGDLKTLIVRPVASARDAEARVRDADFPDREADLLWLMPVRSRIPGG